MKVEDVASHRMHAEWGEVTPDAAGPSRPRRRRGGRVIPVGTTALRLIETARGRARWCHSRGETDIFIYPGFEFRVSDGLMTNFHLPHRRFCMLVSAMMGREPMLGAYDHAVREGYRFFCYGDASLLLP